MLQSKGYSWELLQIRVFGFLRTMVFTWVGEFDVPISMSFSKSLPRSVQPLRQKMKAISIFPWVFQNPYPGQCNPSVTKWKQLQNFHEFFKILTQVSATLPSNNESNLNMFISCWGPKQPWAQRGPIGVMGVIEQKSNIFLNRQKMLPQSHLSFSIIENSSLRDFILQNESTWFRGLLRCIREGGRVGVVCSRIWV